MCVRVCVRACVRVCADRKALYTHTYDKKKGDSHRKALGLNTKEGLEAPLLGLEALLLHYTLHTCTYA